MAGDEARCHAAGMDGYVAKPLRPHALLDVMRRLLAPAQGPAQANGREAS
jgi:CheY-like chemotaxis protein